MSLLKRIEQGQAAGGQPPAAPQQPGAAGPVGGEDQASKLAELRMRRTAPPGSAGAAAGPGGGAAPFADLKSRVQNKLLAELDPSMDISRTAEVRKISMEGSSSAN